jgi:RNA polymerase sigma factor (sigma-70 family)
MDQENMPSLNSEANFENLHTALMYYALTIVKDRDVALDIVAGLLFEFKLKKNRNLLSKETRMVLFRATRNKCVSYLRRETTRRNAYNLLRRDRTNAVDDPLLDAEEVKSEFLAKLQTLLKRLPDRQQEALMGKYLDGLSREELAGRMGISQSTLSKHLGRGLDNLRRWLGVKNCSLLLAIWLFFSDNWKN